MRYLLALAMILVSLPASAELVDGNRIVIIDGDTVALPKTAAFPKGERIRILDIDAPESFKPTCEKERIAGLKAKERLAGLIRGRAVSVHRDGQDRYRRTLAELRIDGRSVGAVLMRDDFALKYVAGEKATRVAHWCGS